LTLPADCKEALPTLEYDLYEVADAGLLDVDDVHDDAAFEHRAMPRLTRLLPVTAVCSYGSGLLVISGCQQIFRPSRRRQKRGLRAALW